MGLMTGKKGVIFGVSNTHGIAYGIAKQLFEESKTFALEKYEELKICLEVFNENGKEFSKGDAGASIYVIQAIMLALAEQFSNVGPVYVTGIYDDATSRAVDRIQVISGITPNGRIDREFINTLSELYNVFVTRNRVANSSDIAYQ